MDYEYASNKFDELIAEINEYPEKLSEADTRCKIIDEILINCLGWEESDIRREEYVNAGYVDYVIRLDGNGLIIEAKKTSIEFNLPANINFESKLSIGSLLKKEKDLNQHYEQVTKYCLDSGIQFGCFTNGLQWIIFTAIRVDGIQIHRSKLIVFNGLNEIKHSFVQFYNIFSKEAFKSNDINHILLPEIGEVYKSYIVNDNERKSEISDRNIISGVLAPVLPNYFGDLIGEESIAKLTKCYVESDALDDKPLSKTVASAPHIIQHKSQSEASENLKRAINVYTHSEGHNGILYFILGRVGSGKSTFLYHFFFVSNINIIQNNLVYYLNFLEYREDKPISDFFYNKLEEISKNQEFFQNFTKIDNLEKIFQVEIEGLKKGPLGRITDESIINEKISELLLEIKQNKQEYFTRIFKYIRKKTNQNTIIIFDNVDQLNPDIQEEIIRFAFSIYQEWNSFVIISMREENYQKSKRDGSLSTIQCNRVHIPRQNIIPIIIKRLNYFEEEIGNKPWMIETYLQSTDVSVEEVQKYIKLVSDSINSESDKVRKFLEAIALGNLRNALELFRNFLTAGNLDSSKIIEIMKLSGEYLIPQHEFVKSISLGDKSFYNEAESPILNLYNISDMSKPSHFTKMRILNILNNCQNQSGPYGQGYEKIIDIKKKLIYVGISDEDVIQSLIQMIQKGLIENDLHSSKYFNQANAIRLTPAGEYYYKILGGRFAYLDIVLQDTPIFDQNSYYYINKKINSTELTDRFFRCEKFIDYLENQEDAELEIIKKMTTDKQLKYKFSYYIRNQFTKDRTFIERKINKRKRTYQFGDFL